MPNEILEQNCVENLNESFLKKRSIDWDNKKFGTLDERAKKKLKLIEENQVNLSSSNFTSMNNDEGGLIEGLTGEDSPLVVLKS